MIIAITYTHTNTHYVATTHSHAHKILDHVIFMCFFPLLLLFCVCEKLVLFFFLFFQFFFIRLKSCHLACVCVYVCVFNNYVRVRFHSVSLVIVFYTLLHILIYDRELEREREKVRKLLFEQRNVACYCSFFIECLWRAIDRFSLFAFHFVPYFCFAFVFPSFSLFGISRIVIRYFFFHFLSFALMSFCTLVAVVVDTLLFTLHDILYILCGTFFSFMSLFLLFFFLIIAAHHHFYGAKFVVIAHIKQRKKERDLHLHCHHTTLNMLCTAFHHNLWIWIRSNKKGRGIIHSLTHTYIHTIHT